MTPVNDFTFYWTAAEKFVSGQNPYVPAVSHSYVMFAPPWILPLIGGLGALPLPVAQLIWTVISVAALLTSSLWLWDLYGEGKIPWWMGLLIAVFTPVFMTFLMGQIGALMLFGLAGFLRYEATKPYLAGAFLFLLALKPQAAFLAWPALLFWAVLGPRWRPLAGFFCALTAATVIVIVLRPGVFREWWTMLHQQQVALYETPTLGTILRHTSGIAWMQYLPAVAALGWFTWRSARTPRWRWESYWSWRVELPMLLLVSIVTTPYAWFTDHLVLLPALFYVAVWLKGRVWLPIAISFVTINAVALALVWKQALFWYTWVSLAWLALYGVAMMNRHKLTGWEFFASEHRD